MSLPVGIPSQGEPMKPYLESAAKAQNASRSRRRVCRCLPECSRASGATLHRDEPGHCENPRKWRCSAWKRLWLTTLPPGMACSSQVSRIPSRPRRKPLTRGPPPTIRAWPAACGSPCFFWLGRLFLRIARHQQFERASPASTRPSSTAAMAAEIGMSTPISASRSTSWAVETPSGNVPQLFGESAAATVFGKRQTDTAVARRDRRCR